MTATIEQVREALAAGECLLCACVENPFEIARALATADPVEDAAGRPVFYWDATDGLVDLIGKEDAPENLDDPVAALGYAERFTGPAIFFLNLDGVALTEDEATLRRKLKSIAGRFAPQERRALLLAGSSPLPDALARLGRCLGYPEKAAPPPPSAPRASSTWADVRRLERFEGVEWSDRLDGLSDEQVGEIVEGEHHVEAVQRVRQLREQLRKLFSQKDALIDLMVYATAAQVPMVLLGPPGTAKSNLIRAFCEGLGLSLAERPDAAEAAEPTSNGEARPTGGLFEYLLTRYTTPEEIFGPVHIPDLIDKRVYRRVTTGRLAEAEVAFLDEIFKASSAIVNTLLTILNERIFHNAGEVQKVPLIMVFAASNEPPQDPALAALYDRFPIRANCPRVPDEHVDELWERAWGMNYDKRFSPDRLQLDQYSCTNDFRLLHRVSLYQYGGRSVERRASTGSFDFNTEFLRIFRSLRRDYDISDRTLGNLYALARAMAIVEGRPRLSSEELNVFRYVSWDETGTGELSRLVSSLKRGIAV
jgi:MoxR-like ATPase